MDRLIVKNATLNRANLLQITARRLPIGNFIKNNFKKALNVSTAALMIPEYLSCQDWEMTFNTIVPNKFSKKLEAAKDEEAAKNEEAAKHKEAAKLKEDNQNNEDNQD